MSQKPRSGVPAYQRIQGSIRKRIDAGQLRPADPVSSERDVAKLNKVNLVAERLAPATLEQEGLVERRRGIGTFVAAPKIHFNKLMGYTEQMAARGLKAASRVLSLKIVDDEPEVASRLSLLPAEPMIKLERVRHADEEPFAYETCYLPYKYSPQFLAASLALEFFFSFLEPTYALNLGSPDKKPDPPGADPHPADLLGAPRREPLLRIRQLIFSTANKPLIFALGIYRS